MALVRLDKFLSDMGIASRKELKAIIRQGRVCIDGVAAVSPDAKLDAESCRVTLDGREMKYARFHYYMIDKPAGVITATDDKKQQTVLDLLPEELRRMGLFPVGRLDKDTSGLLLLTDDGEFAHKVISPKYQIEKLYLATVEGTPDRTDAEAFQSGIVLRDGTKCLPARLEVTGGSECFVTVMEGKYHQVKRMLASRGKPVTALRRLRIGELSLDDNSIPGQFRELDEKDLGKIFMGKML